MANPNAKPPKEHQFKKGQVANPNGRSKMPPDLAKANKLSAKKFIESVNKYINMTKKELKNDLERPEATMLELLVGGMIGKAVANQDPARANFILDRTIGKVIEKMEIDVSVIPKPVVIQRVDGSQVELGHKLIESKDSNTIDVEVLPNRYELKEKDESNS